MELKEGIPIGMTGDDSAAYDWLIGQTISANFRVVKRLGSGGMATVFQAEQISLGKMVAIKVMRSELMTDSKLTQRFELEARAASILNHPHLIQILDCGRDRGFLYIAMELLTGIDLGCLLRRQTRLSLARSARIIDQVLSAVDEAHAHGVVHRDLKPDNIMLVSRRGDPDFVKVCDFGVAKACGRDRPKLTVAGLVFGTPEYMSPEQARGVQVDCRSDLYSIATILYEMIVGQIPFVSTSPADVLARQLLEAPAPPSSHPNIRVPALLEDLIMRGLSKKAADRPQTATAFQAELHRALADVVDHWPSQGPRITMATEVPIPSNVPSAVVTLHGSPLEQPGVPELRENLQDTAPIDPDPSPLDFATAIGHSSARPRPSRRKQMAAVAGVFLVAAIVSTGAFVVKRQEERKLRASRPAPSLGTARPASTRRPAFYAQLPPPVDDEASADEEQNGAAVDVTARANDAGTARAAIPSGPSSAVRAKRAAVRARGSQRNVVRRVPAPTSSVPAAPAVLPLEKSSRPDLMAVTPGPMPAPSSLEGAASAAAPPKPGGPSELSKPSPAAPPPVTGR